MAGFCYADEAVECVGEAEEGGWGSGECGGVDGGGEEGEEGGGDGGGVGLGVWGRGLAWLSEGEETLR